MPHASNVVLCDGPDCDHALDLVPVQPRHGNLDAMCAKCHGRGCWNTEIDLVSFRCKRAICDYCHGAGWVETGGDPIGLPDIERGSDGAPRWITRYIAAPDTPALQELGPLASEGRTDRS